MTDSETGEENIQDESEMSIQCGKYESGKKKNTQKQNQKFLFIIVYQRDTGSTISNIRL